MRRAFSDTVFRLLEADPRVIFLTGDLGFGVFDEIIAKFPNRYINVGVAEAQLVDCAAGLALEGWRPLVYSIASFMTGRAFEQIRLSIGYHQLPITVVGAGGGYIYATSGVTHHAREDLALMRLIPGMTVVAPGDPQEVSALLPKLVQSTGPSYIRIGRFGEPLFHSDAPIEVGKGRLIHKGQKVAICTTGDSVITAVQACEVLRAQGLNPTLAHFHTLEPFDGDCLGRALQDVTNLIVVEDHGPRGGLLDCVQNYLVQTGKSVAVTRLGPGEGLVLGNPTQQLLRARCSYDKDGIVRACGGELLE